jgi:hypothetical protein
MLDRLRDSWGMLRDSFSVFSRFPKLIVPFFIGQILFLSFYATTIVWIRASLRPHATPNPLLCIGLFALFLVVGSLLEVAASAIVLELVQEHESGRPMSFSRGMKAMTRQLSTYFALGMIWAGIRFLIDFLFGKRGKRGPGLLEEALQRALRMGVFCVLPAVAWEGLGVWPAIDKGKAVARKMLVDLSVGYVGSWAVGYLLWVLFGALPLLAYKYSHPAAISTSSPTFYLWMAYVVGLLLIISAYTSYVEQVYCAMLYLWHLKWEFRVRDAKVEGQPLPEIEEIACPTLLDDVAEFAELAKTQRRNQNPATR